LLPQRAGGGSRYNQAQRLCKIPIEKLSGVNIPEYFEKNWRRF
jgi:hypothetical protein